MKTFLRYLFLAVLSVGTALFQELNQSGSARIENVYPTTSNQATSRLQIRFRKIVAHPAYSRFSFQKNIQSTLLNRMAVRLESVTKQLLAISSAHIISSPAIALVHFKGRSLPSEDSMISIS